MRILLCFFLLLSFGQYFSQGADCDSADPFCSGTAELFPNATGIPSAEPGPDYGCLGTTPNPAWYFMQVGIAGDINLTISQTSNGGAGLDVDFICWGPFADLTGACNNLTAGNTVDCSYSLSSIENCNIPNAQVGEFYLMVITNFSNDPGNITFDQTSGNGATDCNIINPCIVDAGPDQTICSGDSAPIGGNPTASGGNDIFTYTWTSPASLDDASASNPIASPTVTTTYTVTASDGSGCSVQDDVTITVEAVDADAGQPAELNCQVNEITLDGSNSSPGTYTWTTDNGSIVSGANSDSPLVDSPGEYQLLVESMMGCLDSATVSISLANDIDVEAVLSGDQSICAGETSNISIALDQVGDYAITYSVNGIPQPSINISGDNYSFTTGAEGLYELVSVTNTICNVDVSGSVDLDVEPLPTLNFPIADQQICPGLTTSIDAIVTGEGPLSYQFAIDGNLEPTVNTVAGTSEISIGQSGTFTPVSISSINCSGAVSGQFNVIDVPEPTATFASDYTICDDETALVTIDLTGNAPYDIDYSFNGSALGSETVFTDQLTFNVADAGLLEITSLSDLYCEGTSASSSTITVTPLPEASISGGGIFCADEIPDLNMSLTGTAPFSVTYTIDGQNPQTIDTDQSDLIFPSQGAGVYEVFSIADATCDDGIQNSTEVSFYPPIDLSIQFTSEVCNGDSVQFIATASGGQSLGYTYDWESSMGNLFMGDTITVVDSTDISLIVIANDDCNIPSDTSFILVEVQDYPVPSIIPSTDSICVGESIVFSRDSIDASVNCIWEFDDGAGEIGCGPVEHTFFESGYQSVHLTTETSAGCQTSLSLDSVVYVVPDAIADFSFTPMEGTIFSPEVQLVDLSENASEVRWDFGDGEFSSQSFPLHLYPGIISESYITCLTAYNALGCSDTICQIVPIESEFLVSIPTAFTPDNDQLNDRIKPIFNDIALAEYSFQIFNRFGEMIFESEDPDEWWNGDGASNDDYYGRDGIYSYYLAIREVNDSEKKEFFGQITLVR